MRSLLNANRANRSTISQPFSLLKPNPLHREKADKSEGLVPLLDSLGLSSLIRRVKERRSLSYITKSPSPCQGEGDIGGEVSKQLIWGLYPGCVMMSGTDGD